MRVKCDVSCVGIGTPLLQQLVIARKLNTFASRFPNPTQERLELLNSIYYAYSGQFNALNTVNDKHYR